MKKRQSATYDPAYYQAHRERIQASHRRWRIKNWVRVQAKQGDYLRERYRTDPSFRTRLRRRAADSYRRRYAAGYFHSHTVQMKQRVRARLRGAVCSGRIQKPSQCDRCRQKRTLHGHHHRGYQHPLSVIWLCASCHGIIHRTNTPS